MQTLQKRIAGAGYILKPKQTETVLVGTCGFCAGGIFPLNVVGDQYRLAFHGKCKGNGSIPESIRQIETYKYRSLPCAEGEWTAEWSVCGFDSLLNGGGVLEWCYGKADAHDLLKIMQAYPQFQNLSISSPEETKIPVYEWCSGNIRPVLWEQIDNGRSLENVRR